MKLTVQEFSMLPVQADLEIGTPDGVGKYEGITASGIVSVFIDGGIKTYTWGECRPFLKLRHLQILEEFAKKCSNNIANQALYRHCEQCWEYSSCCHPGSCDEIKKS